VHGKKWAFKFANLKKTFGVCDSPDTKSKTIKIARGLKPKKELEIVIHELLHASCWNLSEETVDQVAVDLSRILWRIGWRKNDGETLDS